MDVFERMNRRFGSWYEKLIGAAENGDLRPPTVLRRILAAMEDERSEGLDQKIYVPNVYTVRVAVANDEERDYIRTFLSAEELALAVQSAIERYGYAIKGNLVFTVEEVPLTPGTTDRLTVLCRYDATLGNPAPIRSYTADQTADSALAKIRPPEATLTLYGPQGKTLNTYPLTTRGTRIGRGREQGNDLILDDGMVSKRHARIAFENNRFVLYDENSTNGTFVNDERVTPGVGVTLRSGDEIRLGDTFLRFLWQNVPDTTPDQFPTIPAPRTGNRKAAPAEENTRLDWNVTRPTEAVAFRLLGPNGETYPLASEMTVGRSLTGDITLIGAGVASQHARLHIRGADLYVEDLGTGGATAVNGEPIPANFAVVLYDGDDIAFGEVTLRVQKFTVGSGG